jgi:gamma-butyrobetaine dioxygenase
MLVEIVMPRLTEDSPARHSIEPSDRYVAVNGKRFHYIWLRDHCLCCRHPKALQKKHDISDFPRTPKPLSIKLQNDNLIIDWEEQPSHQSIFPISWLLSRAYDLQATQNPESHRQTILWDNVWLEQNSPHWNDFDACDSELWMNQLETLGFTLLRNLPWENLDSFVSSIGPVYHLAGNGLYSTIKVMEKAKANDLAKSDRALLPHTDVTYMSAPLLVQLLYCVENSASGGESILVDGFRVIRDMQKDYPQHIETLSQNEVKFYHLFPLELGKYFVSYKTPIVELDKAGELRSIHCSHKNFVCDLPFDKVEKIYEAYQNLFCYLKNTTYQYCFRMQPGDCLLIQNFRILHGRQAFDSSAGSRHLEIAYIPWDYFAGRRAFDRQIQKF